MLILFPVLAFLALAISAFALFSNYRLDARCSAEAKRRDEQLAAILKAMPKGTADEVAEVSAKYAGGWQPE